MIEPYALLLKLQRRIDMKRTISILVIVAMMLAAVLAIVPVSAATPEGTAINNANDFANMSSTGVYYLANDITLTAMYDSAIFAGTLDGNGKTITLEGIPTAIKEMSGATVSNLNLVVNYEVTTDVHTGALSRWANGTFTNITATVNYTVPAGGKDSTTAKGALLAEINGASTFTNCVTYGSISILNNSTKDGQSGDIRYNGAGGFAGKVYAAKGVNFINCETNVEIVNTQTNVSSGGFIGGVESGTQLYFENCVNNGNVSGTAKNHMGISGFVGLLGPNASSTTKFVNCRNNGNLVDLGVEGHQNAYMGGFVGRNYGSPSVTIENCINTGDVTCSGGGWSGAGGFVGNGMTHGYSWTVSAPGVYTFKNCINLGDITGAQFSGGIGGAFKQHSLEGCNVTMENCANYGAISGVDYAGGMLGQVGDHGCDIVVLKNCYNAGDVTANSGAAGIAGYILHNAGSSTGADSYNIVNRSPMLIDNCANVGTITCTGTQDSYVANMYVAAGILARFGDETNGAVVDITISNCVNLGVLANVNYATDVAQITPEYKKDDYKCNDTNISLAGYDAGVNKFVKTADEATVTAKVAAIAAVTPGDFTALETALSAVLDYEAADYTEGWDAFAAARAAALVLVSRASSQADLDSALEDLNTAILGLRSNANVDLTALEAAIADAAKYENAEATYTPATWAAFASALDTAKKTLNSAKQSTIDAATAALTDAIAKLAAKPDTAALEAILAKVAGYAEADYVSATWTAFKTALANANAAKSNVNATQADVDGVVAALTAADAALVAKADTAELAAKVAEITATYNKDDYTARSYGEVRTALRAAEEAIATGDVGAEDIATLAAALDAAVAGLLKLGNFEVVEPLVDEADDLVESKYTPESWAALVEALDAIEAAQKPASAGNVSEDDVAALKAALEAAIAGLVAYADYTALDALIASVDSLVEADYTAESWAAVKAAITEANTLKSNKEATAAQADAALAALQAAIDSLVAAAAPTEPATEPVKEGGCGGVIGATAVVITAVLGLGAVVLKKREN